MTSKQQRFCEEYLSNGFNATQAAISAGYSKKTSHAIGQENLKKPIIADYIKSQKKKDSNRLQITRDSQLKDLEDFKKIAKKTKQIAAGISAIKAQNEMLGLNEPEGGGNDIVITYTRKHRK